MPRCLLPGEVVKAPGADEGLVEEESDGDEEGEEGHLLGRERSRDSRLVVGDESSSEEEAPREGSDAEYTSDEDSDNERRRRSRQRASTERLKPPREHRKDRRKKQKPVKDSSGRTVPVSERAPVR